jgi:hypothetical protein
MQHLKDAPAQGVNLKRFERLASQPLQHVFARLVSPRFPVSLTSAHG